MEYKETYDELRALQNRAFSLLKKDKKRIRELSKELGIDFVERENCKNCFSDQLIRLSIAVKKHLSPLENAICNYEVIGNKDVIIRGHRINNEIITNEIAEWLMKVYPYHEKYIKRK